MGLKEVWEKAWARVGRTVSERPRTFHNLECGRLRGRKCNCEMAVTFTPPNSFTPIDGIRYSYPEQSTMVPVEVEDAGFIKVFKGDDLVDEYPKIREDEGLGFSRYDREKGMGKDQLKVVRERREEG
jgi:hypothetical protein